MFLPHFLSIDSGHGFGNYDQELLLEEKDQKDTGISTLLNYVSLLLGNGPIASCPAEDGLDLILSPCSSGAYSNKNNLILQL